MIAPTWERDGVRLYLGDCLDVLPMFEVGSVDAVVTDPFYGIDGARGSGNIRRGKGNYIREGWTDTPDEVSRVAVPTIQWCVANTKRVAVTPGTRCMFRYPQPDDVGCFWTPAATGCSPWGFNTFHPIFYYGKDPRAGRVWPNGKQLTERPDCIEHPCAKPIKAWTWLVERASLDGETILDPFMGSGTTGVACVQTGRKFIGIEIEPKYFEIAVKRIEQAMLQIRMPL